MRTPTNSHRISALAYQLWEQEGRPTGRDRDHWERAQKQLEVEFRVGFPDATSEDSGGGVPGGDSGVA
jgi:hypothetical protein